MKEGILLDDDGDLSGTLGGGDITPLFAHRCMKGIDEAVGLPRPLNSKGDEVFSDDDASYLEGFLALLERGSTKGALEPGETHHDGTCAHLLLRSGLNERLYEGGELSEVKEFSREAEAERGIL